MLEDWLARNDAGYGPLRERLLAGPSEALLDGFGQGQFELDGVAIHVLPIRSQHQNAMPLTQVGLPA